MKIVYVKDPLRSAWAWYANTFHAPPRVQFPYTDFHNAWAGKHSSLNEILLMLVPEIDKLTRD